MCISWYALILFAISHLTFIFIFCLFVIHLILVAIRHITFVCMFYLLARLSMRHITRLNEAGENGFNFQEG